MSDPDFIEVIVNAVYHTTCDEDDPNALRAALLDLVEHCKQPPAATKLWVEQRLASLRNPSEPPKSSPSDAAKNLADAVHGIADALPYPDMTRCFHYYADAIIAAAVERAREPNVMTVDLTKLPRRKPKIADLGPDCSDDDEPAQPAAPSVSCSTDGGDPPKMVYSMPAAPSKAREWRERAQEARQEWDSEADSRSLTALNDTLDEAVSLIEAAEKDARLLREQLNFAQCKIDAAHRTIESEQLAVEQADKERDAAIRERDEARGSLDSLRNFLAPEGGDVKLPSGRAISTIKSLREKLRDAEAAKHEHAAAVLRSYFGRSPLKTRGKALLEREEEAARAARAALAGGERG